MIGPNVEADTENGFFMNVNDQVEEVCAKLKNDSALKVGADWLWNDGGYMLGIYTVSLPTYVAHSSYSQCSKCFGENSGE